MENLTQEQLIALHEKANLIELKPVMSSNIGGIGYDAENKLLKVAFKGKTSNTMYLYENVEKETYDALFTSGSIGKKLNESIVRQKDKYNYIKL